MKKLNLILPSELSFRKEILLRKEPPAACVLIWTSVILLLSVFCWIVFGKMEEVVKASGLIRPISNISLVRNVLPGEVSEICYKPGQEVKAGDVLLKIRPDSFLAQKRSIETQITDIKDKLSGVNEIIRSYYADRNLVSRNNLSAYARYESYSVEKNLLFVKARMANLLWEEERQLPASGTTPLRIRQLEYEKQLSDIDLQKLKIQFLTSISSERDAYSVELEKFLSQLEQIDTNLRSTILYSPVDGYVQETSSINVDDYLFSNQEIIKIVPDTNLKFRVELKIPAKSAGKLNPGMEVKLRFPAFPFFEFKGALGVIQTIDPDAIAAENGELYFTVLTDIDRTVLTDKKGREYPIRVGLQTDARIILESKTILLYLLKKMDFLL